MVFSSLIFLFAYLTVTLALYYAVPLKWRNLVLFILSLVFYGWGEPKYIALMLLSILSAYAFGFGIEHYRVKKPPVAKLFLGISVGINLSFLLFFKYFNFFAQTVGANPIQGLILPVGISFYTFQIMSYSIDLYRGDVPLAKKFVPFGTYVTLFPQLIAGPIVRYKDVCDQLRARRETVSKFASGVTRFVLGLGKKLILGDAAAALAERLQTAAEFSPTALGAWLIVLCYSFHIYFDFSGYSDMAIGLGRMFGFEFVENFNYPYIARSISDFWRRWHITLSTWFKEYVYIPLGGNRVGKLRGFCNLAAVWFLTGFWHGADWNYMLWGLYFWLFLVLEKAFLGKILNKNRPLSHLYALLVIGFGWLIFFNDLGALTTTAGHLVGVNAIFADGSVLHLLLRMLPFLLICALACTPLPKQLLAKAKDRLPFVEALLSVGTMLLFLLCVAYMVDNSFSPFLYYIF
ncbi:MAG: MBOAT family protein [Ruminococcaceae bacterium]|nr:MBOAT family protein [Oscillospiraceae bacterium]